LSSVNITNNSIDTDEVYYNVRNFNLLQYTIVTSNYLQYYLFNATLTDTTINLI